MKIPYGEVIFYSLPWVVEENVEISIGIIGRGLKLESLHSEQMAENL